MRLEELPKGPATTIVLQPSDSHLTVDEFEADEIAHHFWMLQDAGFVTWGPNVRTNHSGSLYFQGLSKDGRDFLDTVREPETWHETKSRAKAIGGFTLSVLADIGKTVLKSKLAEHGWM